MFLFYKALTSRERIILHTSFFGQCGADVILEVFVVCVKFIRISTDNSGFEVFLLTAYKLQNIHK